MKHLLRSLMFVPGHDEKLIDKAANSPCDVLLLDLEDSVQPSLNKENARSLIKRKINSGVLKKHSVFPRINDRESGELLKDLYELTIPGVEGFMYPKSKTGEDVYFIDKLLETIEHEKKIPIGSFKLIPLIETAAAVLNAQDICKASRRTIAIAYGCEDFISDIEGIHDLGESSLFTPRALIAMAARANNIIPIDTVHIAVHDLDGLEKNLKIARNLGFEGMLLLNPKEIPLVHKYFSPSDKEINDAQEIIDLSELANAQNIGVAIINNKFIGPPMLRAAKKIMRKHQLIMSKEPK